MEEESEIQKLKAQYKEYFKDISDEFLNFVFSKDLFYQIAEICFENGIEDGERIEKIANRITLVLFKQIPKENLTEVLMKGVGLDFETSKRISSRAEELIFAKAPKMIKEKPKITETLKLEKREEKPKVVPPETIKRDIYREPIE
jgi:hypothetical protein